MATQRGRGVGKATKRSPHSHLNKHSKKQSDEGRGSVRLGPIEICDINLQEPMWQALKKHGTFAEPKRAHVFVESESSLRKSHKETEGSSWLQG